MRSRRTRLVVAPGPGWRLGELARQYESEGCVGGPGRSSGLPGVGLSGAAPLVDGLFGLIAAPRRRGPAPPWRWMPRSSGRRGGGGCGAYRPAGITITTVALSGRSLTGRGAGSDAYPLTAVCRLGDPRCRFAPAWTRAADGSEPSPSV